MAEKAGEGSVASSPARRQSEGSGTPSLASFSSFREMLREERESARAEREAARANERAERQAWVAEQRRLMDEEVELRVQLALSGRQTKSAAQGSPAVEGRSTFNFVGANSGPTFRMEDPAWRFAGIGATGSRGESSRSHAGAVQGSAAAVSGRVPDLSGTKLDCGRLSVESEWVEEERASNIVQHQIPQHPSTPARLESPDQSKEDCGSEAAQTSQTERCGDNESSCPDLCTEFGHAVQESTNEGTSLVQELEQFRLPGHKLDGFGNDSGRCLGHLTTEPSTIAGNSPTQARLETNLADDSSNDDLKQPQLVDVRPRLNKISPPDLECMPPEEGRLSLSPRFPLEQHYVHPREGRPLSSKNARKDPRHAQNAPVAIEEPPVSPKIARPEPASTTFPPGLRSSSLGEEQNEVFDPGVELLLC